MITKEQALFVKAFLRTFIKGSFSVRNAVGGGSGGVRIHGKKHYEGVLFNVISITRGWVGVAFSGKSIT